MQALRAPLLSPWRLFLVFAVPFGLLFLVATPPFGGGDEPHHFQRTYEVATGQFLHEAKAPAGFVAFHTDAYGQLPLHAQRSISYADPALWRRWDGIMLDAAHQVPMPPDILAQQYPLTYVVPALGMRVGLWLGLKPLWLLYLCRLACFLGSTALTAYAIYIAPRHHYLIACVSLLPTAVFLRSYVIGDGVETSLCYVLIMLVWRAIVADGELLPKNLVAIALAAFFAAQGKSAYLLLPAITLLIPRERFASRAARTALCASALLPGLAAAFFWALHEQALHANLHYQTWGGDVNPSAQAQFILSHPLAFGATLLRTIFLSPMLPGVFIGMLAELGWMDVYLPPWAYGFIAAAIAAVIFHHPSMRPYNGNEKKTYAALFFLTCLFISFYLYVEWTGYEAPVIKGWMGRYLYPLLPLLFAFLPATGKPAAESGLRCGIIIACLAAFSLSLSLYELVAHYYL